MNKNSNLWISVLVAGLTLGTAWAVRGKFGHEQGAAWAGGIGALAVILLAKRGDWYSKFLTATLAAAVGWGVGGMMSYGRVVGYGRGEDFGNVYYGLLMLFVIGGLYGLIGGGFFGLALTDSRENKVKWHILILEMTAWGLIIYSFLVGQLGWLMTPPRSELWAACLGMGIALVWYLIRNRHHSALRVAIYSTLGGGFGFAFGNFLQVMGNVSGLQFGWWNVMEYSIGFFGGAGMAYGTFTSDWPDTGDTRSRQVNLIPLILLVLFIPFVIYDQSFGAERIQEMLVALEIGAVDFWLFNIKFLALASMAGLAIFSWYKYYFNKPAIFTGSYAAVNIFFIPFFAVYIFLSFLITGTILKLQLPEQWLYLVNFALILYTLPRQNPGFNPQTIQVGKWSKLFLLVLAVIALLAWIAIASHGEMPGSHRRFE